MKNKLTQTITLTGRKELKCGVPKPVFFTAVAGKTMGEVEDSILIWASGYIDLSHLNQV